MIVSLGIQVLDRQSGIAPWCASEGGNKQMKSLLRIVIVTALPLGLAMPATAATVIGEHNGVSYKATSTIIGTTSTATGVGGGDPRYFATAPRYSGVVALIMQQANGDRFICSGSLMSDRRSVLTAGHCVSGGAGSANPTSTTAYFYGGSNEAQVLTAAGSTARTVSDYFVNSSYTGQVIDENDIAVVRLADLAPDFATSYDLYTGNASGQNFNVAGVGGRSDTGGDVGVNLGTGRRRQGDNLFDFALGDAGINGGFDFLSDGASINNVLLADFDNGNATNDASCIATLAVGITSARYCNLGRGASEASIAGGDSGGPSFIDGKVASITSFGLTFGSDFGDVDDDLNSSFGEFGGYVSTAYHANWINSVLAPAVPEPATWAMMILGFGVVGASMRRRKRNVTTTVVYA